MFLKKCLTVDENSPFHFFVEWTSSRNCTKRSRDNRAMKKKKEKEENKKKGHSIDCLLFFLNPRRLKSVRPFRAVRAKINVWRIGNSCVLIGNVDRLPGAREVGRSQPKVEPPGCRK